MISLSNVSKVYRTAAATVAALDDVSLTISQGEICAVMGPSGAGKSTLMNIIGLLDRPTAGTVTIGETRISEASHDHLAHLRNRLIGFVFQSFHLVPNLTVIENVAMPLAYRGVGLAAAKSAALERLIPLGMAGYAKRRPDELSGGQKQRVAIARALVGRPPILLADEPTGALDAKTGSEILDVFQALNAEGRTTVIIVTHDASVARRCRRVLRIIDGRVASDEYSLEACSVPHATAPAQHSVSIEQ